jgi:hypothetical protein
VLPGAGLPGAALPVGLPGAGLPVGLRGVVLLMSVRLGMRCLLLLLRWLAGFGVSCAVVLLSLIVFRFFGIRVAMLVVMR